MYGYQGEEEGGMNSDTGTDIYTMVYKTDD